MIGRDPNLLEPVLPVGGHGIGEGPLEAHEVGPGDVRLTGYSSALHPAVPVRELRRTHEDFLRVASAQRARPAVRKLIGNGYPPSRRPPPGGRPPAARPGAPSDGPAGSPVARRR